MEPAPSPKPCQKPKILAAQRYIFSVNALAVGMDDYIRARPDIYFTGRDGSLRSNRVLCQLAGQYAVDAFIGSTLQIDGDANSSAVTAGRMAGFGGLDFGMRSNRARSAARGRSQGEFLGPRLE